MPIIHNNIASWDKAAALKLLEGDTELLYELMQLFIENMPQQMTRMQNALTSLDYKELANSAHAIKGMLSNFFAETTYALALKLEQSARNYPAECSLLSQNLLAALQQLLLVFQQELDAQA